MSFKLKVFPRGAVITNDIYNPLQAKIQSFTPYINIINQIYLIFFLILVI